MGIVPTLLCQNHTNVIKGFMGQTTDFKKSLIKSDAHHEIKALKISLYSR